MTKTGAVIIILVALMLGGLGYAAYLKENPGAKPAWAEAVDAKQVVPVVAVAIVLAVVGGATVGVHRHHARGNAAWEEFAAEHRLSCANAKLLEEKPSRIQGQVDGHAFELVTRSTSMQTGGGRRSSVRSEMRLELRGAPASLNVHAATLGLGAGLLGKLAQGAAQYAAQRAGVAGQRIETGDADFDGAALAYCPDAAAAQAWLAPRTEALRDFLSERGSSLQDGHLVHSAPGKTDSVAQLNESFQRLRACVERLEA